MVGSIPIIPIGDSDLFLVACSLHVDCILSYFFTELKIYQSIFLYLSLTWRFWLLILSVCRMHVIHEPCLWPSPPRVLHSSVGRALILISVQEVIHRFDSCQGLKFFLCPVLVTCWSDHFSFLHWAYPVFFTNHSKEELLGFWRLRRLAWLVCLLGGLFTSREKCFSQTNYTTDKPRKRLCKC